MNTRVPQPIKFHGGKFYLAPQIIKLMGPHIHYCEPYAGGLAVLLAKDPEGVSEVASDLNPGLMTFWEVMRDKAAFERFHFMATSTEFNETLWMQAASEMQFLKTLLQKDAVKAAWNFFVWCRQSLAGRMKSFTGITKTRTRRKMNNEVSAWLTSIEGLPEVHARMQRVMLLCRPALEIIETQDGPTTQFYLDPSYLAETRASPNVYEFEMSKNDHRDLLDTIKQCKGKILISGYHSALYDRELKDWTLTELKVPNAAAGGKTKRIMTECIWRNY